MIEAVELEASFERFNREKYSRTAWRTYGSEPDGYAVAVWTQMAQLGWLALGLPESVGGMGACIRDLLPLFIAAGQGLWREPLLQTLGDACGALLALPASSTRDHLLSGIVAGTRRLAFPCPQLTSALSVDTRRGDLRGFVARGRASHVVGAVSCTDLIIPGGGESLTTPLFAVARTAPGVSITTFPTIDNRVAAHVDLNTTPGYLIGRADVIAGARRRSYLLAAAEATGIMNAVIAMTIAHLQSRQQFGQPLARLQALRYRVVEMHILRTETAACLWAVAKAYDASSEDLDRQLSRLRVQSARAARFVTQQAIQLHGAMGMTAELAIGDYYKRVLTLNSCYLRPEPALEALAGSSREPGEPPLA